MVGTEEEVQKRVGGEGIPGGWALGPGEGGKSSGKANWTYLVFLSLGWPPFWESSFLASQQCPALASLQVPLGGSVSLLSFSLIIFSHSTLPGPAHIPFLGSLQTPY